MKHHKTNLDKEALHFMRQHPRYAILGYDDEQECLTLLSHLPPGHRLICCQESPDGHVQVYAGHYASRAAVARVLVEVVQDLRGAGLPKPPAEEPGGLRSGDSHGQEE
uniref:Uncharacterized protein n=1 Tax=viral metagenome TaxID=1070528 RepID=A0A6H1ZBN5_9ZZZZ